MAKKREKKTAGEKPTVTREFRGESEKPTPADQAIADMTRRTLDAMERDDAASEPVTGPLIGLRALTKPPAQVSDVVTVDDVSFAAPTSGGGPTPTEVARAIHADWGRAREVKGERVEPTPAEAAQDAAVGETLRPETIGQAWSRVHGAAEPLRFAPTQPVEVDAGPLSEADRRLIANLESAYAEDGREVANLQQQHEQTRAAAAMEEGMAAGDEAPALDDYVASGTVGLVPVGSMLGQAILARARPCTTCGGLVLPGATCPTDGQVAR